MIFIIYDILLTLALPLVALSVLSRTLRGKRRRGGVLERLGFISRQKRELLCRKPFIWVHAVSVGETMAVRPLLRALRRRFPDHAILLSTVTETGQELASSFSEVDHRLYLPYDLSVVVSKVLDSVRPSCLIIMETELWPNLVRCARAQGVPVLLANGRISDRSFPRYLRLRWFWRQVLVNFSALCMQSAEDARRIAAMGAPAAAVHDAGNLKFDCAPQSCQGEDLRRLAAAYAFPSGVPAILAASTHAGEEEAILAIYSRMRKEGMAFVPVLVPRHPERAGQVAEMVRSAGWRPRLRSTLPSAPEPLAIDEILLVDTIGELGKLYCLASLAFVGGSLVPVGGHNVLEPLAAGTATLFGPHMHNFRDITSLVLNAGAALQVRDAAGLEKEMLRLLGDEEGRGALASAGTALLERTGGAVERHLQIIYGFLREGA